MIEVQAQSPPSETQTKTTEYNPWKIIEKRPYLSEVAIKGILAHNYKANTHSISYKYCWSPFANWLVEFLPDWIAPNLITLFGFLHGVIFFFLIIGIYGT